MAPKTDTPVAPKTADRYTKTATMFYARYLGDTPPTPKKLADALRRAAPNYRKNSWMALRSAVAWHQQNEGYAAAAERVRDTQWPDDLPNRPPSGRPKKVTEADSKKIEALLAARVDDEGDPGAVGLYAAYTFARVLGCRANEMPGVRVLGDGRVFVPGSKFTEKNDRGLDRTLLITDPDDYAMVAWAVDALAAEPGYDEPANLMNAIQQRWRRMTEKVFPRRKHRPVLHSFRHQLGSDLKRSDRDRREIAYIMGHRATRSLQKYGDARSGRDRSTIKPGIPAEEVNELITQVNHIHEEQFVTEYENGQPVPKPDDDDPFVPTAPQKKPPGPKM